MNDLKHLETIIMSSKNINGNLGSLSKMSDLNYLYLINSKR